MIEINIDYYKRYAGSPAELYYLDARNELRDAELDFPRMVSIDWDSQVFVATTPTILSHEDDIKLISGGHTIGFMVFKFFEYKAEYHIFLSWVRADFRGKGVFDQMFERLVQRARDNGVCSIESGTHINNKVAQRAFERQGRKANYIGYSYAVSDFTLPSLDKKDAP